MESIAMDGFELSPQQKRLFDLQHDGAKYHGHVTLAIEALEDRNAIKEAIRKVVARHEILRTTFRKLDGITTPLQFISDEPDFVWEEIEATSREEESVALEPHLSGTVGGFLGYGSPLRACLIVRPGNNYVLHLFTPSV